MYVSAVILRPYLVEKIWGGSKLSKIKRLEKGELPLGETWEVSCLKTGPSFTSEGPLDQQVTEERLPYLIKFIDTSDNLSVQVHPDDEYAGKHKLGNGKSECWLILDAEEGAGIYLGFKPDVKKEDFEKAVINEEDLTRFLKFHSVQRGDFFYVPAGSVHAIGKNVLLAEVQQSADTTFRVWDWNRKDKEGKSRELHIAQALEVLNFKNEDNSEDVFQIKKNIFNQDEAFLLDHRDFEVHSFVIKENCQLAMCSAKGERIRSIICLKGKVSFVDSDIELSAYESAILMNGSEVSVQASEDSEIIFVR